MQRIQYLGSDARHEMWAEKRKVKKPRNWRSISGKSRFQTRWKREITFGKRKKERIERKNRGDRRMRDKAQRFVEFWKVRTWTRSWERKDHVESVKRGNYELQRGEHHTRRKTHVITSWMIRCARCLAMEWGRNREIGTQIYLFREKDVRLGSTRDCQSWDESTCRLYEINGTCFSGNFCPETDSRRFMEIRRLILDTVLFSFWRQQDATCTGRIGQETRDWVS